MERGNSRIYNLKEYLMVNRMSVQSKAEVCDPNNIILNT